MNINLFLPIKRIKFQTMISKIYVIKIKLYNKYILEGLSDWMVLNNHGNDNTQTGSITMQNLDTAVSSKRIKNIYIQLDNLICLLTYVMVICLGLI